MKHESKLYLDDLAVGQIFHSPEFLLTEERIKAFAQSYDPQPFHLDNAQAQETLFKGLAASGWQTASITMRLLVDGGAPIASGVIGAGVDISWPTPTRPGDTLRARTEVIDVKPSQSRPDRGIVTVRVETINQHDVVVQTMTSKLVVMRSRHATA